MHIKKHQLNNIFYIFLIIHLVIWTLAPSVLNKNLPLDTIEALAWSTNMDWGFNKHPPASAFFVGIFYKIFGPQDWAYYLLSQIFVITAFYAVWEFSKNFFKNKFLCLISVLILETIYFYNFTTPEFNVNVSQLPFWALTILYCWKGFKGNNIYDWLLMGVFAAIGCLSKYLFIYLLAAINVTLIYFLIRKKINFRFMVFLIPFILILLPHLIWLTQNDYITIIYGLHRTGSEGSNFLNHLIHPLIFLAKQIGILIPFFIMIFISVSKFKIKLNFKDEKLLFLIGINILPIFFIFLTSLIMGVKIRTMWMTPFYLFFGVLFIYIFQNKINFNQFKIDNILVQEKLNSISSFIILFIFSFFLYSVIGLISVDKRTNYNGKVKSFVIDKYYQNKNIQEVRFVMGDEWQAGNYSFYSRLNPQWILLDINNLEEYKKNFNPYDYNGTLLIGDWINPEECYKWSQSYFSYVKIRGIKLCNLGLRNDDHKQLRKHQIIEYGIKFE